MFGFGGANKNNNKTAVTAGVEGTSKGESASASEHGSAASAADETASFATSDVADGEWLTLVESLEETSPPLVEEMRQEIKRTFSEAPSNTKAGGIYGQPLSVQEAQERMPLPASNDNNNNNNNNNYQNEGLVWNATVIPDAFFVDGKLKRGLNPKDFDIDKKAIKVRRASLPVTETDFFSSLTKINVSDANDNDNGDDHHPRYIFHGVLNGWPSLQTLELISLEQKRDMGVASIPTPKDLYTGQIAWHRVWQASVEGAKGMEPALKDHTRVYRAKLRAAPWSAVGWSRESPGFVFWFEALHPHGPRVSYGTNLTKVLGDEKCTKIHMISHRYARLKESPKDRLTYHSICLLEWEHGEYCTVVESAYLNGMGGYQGKSNWYDDKDNKDGLTSLFCSLPQEMIAPWRQTSAEIRCYDVPYKSHEDFKSYMFKYEGRDKRFIDPQFHFSHPARLTFRSRAHIAQYLINYISRDTSYGELKRNCQTFCADFSAFIAGKKGIVPFHPVSRVEYHNRTYLFLYDSFMYESKQAKKPKAKQPKS